MIRIALPLSAVFKGWLFNETMGPSCIYILVKHFVIEPLHLVMLSLIFDLVLIVTTEVVPVLSS